MSCITKLLEMKGDNEILPIHDEYIIEGGGTYKGYEYLIVLNTNGHRCGYVALPPEHKYSQTPEEERSFMGGRKYKHWDYDSLNIDVHGGLTFMSPDHGLKDLLPIPCTDMWIGFDCGHHGDMCDVDAHERYFGTEENKEKESFFRAMNHGYEGQTVKVYDYVRQECESVIDQLIQVAA